MVMTTKPAVGVNALAAASGLLVGSISDASSYLNVTLREIFSAPKLSAPLIVPEAPSAPISVRVDEDFLVWLFDIRMAAVIAVGIFCGILLRAAFLFDETSAWANIKKDMVVCMLAAAANFIITMWIATETHLSHLEGLGIAVIIASTGVGVLRVLKTKVVNYVTDRIFGGSNKPDGQG